MKIPQEGKLKILFYTLGLDPTNAIVGSTEAISQQLL